MVGAIAHVVTGVACRPGMVDHASNYSGVVAPTTSSPLSRRCGERVSRKVSPAMAPTIEPLSVHYAIGAQALQNRGERLYLELGGNLRARSNQSAGGAELQRRRRRFVSLAIGMVRTESAPWALSPPLTCLAITIEARASASALMPAFRFAYATKRLDGTHRQPSWPSDGNTPTRCSHHLTQVETQCAILTTRAAS